MHVDILHMNKLLTCFINAYMVLYIYTVLYVINLRRMTIENITVATLDDTSLSITMGLYSYNKVHGYLIKS